MYLLAVLADGQGGLRPTAGRVPLQHLRARRPRGGRPSVRRDRGGGNAACGGAGSPQVPCRR